MLSLPISRGPKLQVKCNLRIVKADSGSEVIGKLGSRGLTGIRGAFGKTPCSE